MARQATGWIFLVVMVICGGSVRGEAPVMVWSSPGGDPVDVEIRDGLPVKDEEVKRWVGLAEAAITGYFGHFPVKGARLVILPGEGRGGVQGGMTFPNLLIRIHMGPGTTAEDLTQDWMLTHEMFHLSFPDLDEDYHYLEEGLSDYLEPLARARVGNLTDEEVWWGYVEGMPKGQPRAGDRGLDGTQSWGRTYWGGCTFWLLADVRIRQQTGNKKSLDDAIRAILEAGGNITQEWPLEKVIAVGDKATGTHVIAGVHDELGKKAVKVDLNGLWKKLGVVPVWGEKTVKFDDTAPWAAMRKSMTAKRE